MALAYAKRPASRRETIRDNSSKKDCWIGSVSTEDECRRTSSNLAGRRDIVFDNRPVPLKNGRGPEGCRYERAALLWYANRKRRDRFLETASLTWSFPRA